MTTPINDSAIRDLYRALLDGWNARDADALGALYLDDANVVGFDGSILDGRAQIANAMRDIFRDHATGTYVGEVRSVRWIGADVTVLNAIAGMVPAGKDDLDPALNAVQTLVAVLRDGLWRVAVYQNTPAAFHGRPELVRQMTDELRQVRLSSR